MLIIFKEFWSHFHTFLYMASYLSLFIMSCRRIISFFNLSSISWYRCSSSSKALIFSVPFSQYSDCNLFSRSLIVSVFIFSCAFNSSKFLFILKFSSNALLKSVSVTCNFDLTSSCISAKRSDSSLSF